MARERGGGSILMFPQNMRSISNSTSCIGSISNLYNIETMNYNQFHVNYSVIV